MVRPEWMVPGLVIEKIAESLNKISPNELKIVGSASEYDK